MEADQIKSLLDEAVNRGADANQVREIYGRLQTQSTPVQQQSQQQGFGDYAADIGKSAGTGLGQGAIGMITGPLDLGAQAGGYLAKKAVGNSTMGIDPNGIAYQGLDKLFGPNGLLPEAPPSATNAAIDATGLDYQPQTMPGKFANTIAAFVPSIATGNIGNGASLMQNAGNVAKQSALAGGLSEGLGQITEGTEAEPYARLAGAVIPSLVGKAASPQVKDQTKIPAMLSAEKFDVPVYRNQLQDKGLLKATASLQREIPGSGAAGKIDAQTAAFNRAVNKTIGETGDAVTPERLGTAYDRISKVYDDITNKYNAKIDSGFEKKFFDLLDEGSAIGDTSKEHAFNTMAKNISDKIKNGELAGDTYQGIRSQIGRLMRGQTSSPELGQLQNLIDDQFSKSMSLGDRMRFKTARTQYRNMLALEDVVGRNPNAPIQPGMLQGSVKSKFGDYAYGGKSDLEELARLGNLLKDNYPNSGTAQRTAVLKGLKTAGAIGGAGAIGYAGSENPEETAAGLGGALLLSRLGINPLLFQKMSTKAPAFNNFGPAAFAGMGQAARNGGQ